VPHHRASRLSDSWDPPPVSRNDAPGLTGAFQPRVHDLLRAAFEALGERPLAGRIPAWTA
jgi:hypothetical protein